MASPTTTTPLSTPTIEEDYAYIINYLPLHKAALNDDWHAAELIFAHDSSAATAKITYLEETLLHVAVGTNASHTFVCNLINLIWSTDPTQLRATDRAGNNALHVAARTGRTRAARALVERDPGISLTADRNGVRAVLVATVFARKETLIYLLGVTEDVVDEDGSGPYSGLAGGELITHTISAGFYDVALYLVEKYPNLATERNNKGITAIQTLATRPKDFPSGTSLWFWKKLIYVCMPIDSRIRLRETSPQAESALGLLAFACSRLHLLISRVIRCIVPVANRMGDLKLIHAQTDQLTKAICANVMNTRHYGTIWEVLGPSIHAATVHGIHELIEESLRCYPGLISYKSEGSYFIFNAIKYRQVKVYNLIYQMRGHIAFAHVTDGENALHQVARLSLPHRISSVAGAALQMQRELQWFKEVEKFVQPSDRDMLNKERKTPRMLFTEEHTNMVEKGKKWMKDTSSSSMVVAALIFTLTFAAIITVPGVLNGDDGMPLHGEDPVFILFVASVIVGLFASATSVLMFLAILTSSFAEHDYLYALPKRLILGLLSLFMSIAATMIAFTAAAWMVLVVQASFISLMIALIACVPITLFMFLQFPLLVELVISTYGRSIFHKQNNFVLS